MYYVYLHRFTNGVFYIGKGYGKRFFKVSNRNNNFYNNLLKKYGPPIKGIYRDNLTEEDSFKLEITLIRLFKEANIPICNLTNGGEGISGYKHSNATKEKMKLVKIGKPNNNCQDYIKTCKVHPSAKQVKCIETGVVFTSVTEAALSCNASISNVTKVCKGLRNRTKNLTFKYV